MSVSYNFANKLVFVTGSTLGIGKAIAEEFVKCGATVIVNGRDQKTVEQTKADLEKLVNKNNREAKVVVHALTGDVAKAADVDAMVAQIAKIGPLDILINNVGIFGIKHFAEVTDEEWLNFFNVNVMSAVRLCRAYLPAMLKRGSGRIVNVSSEAGVRPIPGMIHYSTTKTALIGLSRGLAELTKGTAVTVNSLLAGPTMTAGVRGDYLAGWYADFQKKKSGLREQELNC